jgi:hypothetical protein
MAASKALGFVAVGDFDNEVPLHSWRDQRIRGLGLGKEILLL